MNIHYCEDEIKKEIGKKRVCFCTPNGIGIAKLFRSERLFILYLY